jgi:putative hydrolase of the HAD superfamily
MIKNIIFDMGGVIIRFTPKETFKRYFPDNDDSDRIFDVLFRQNIWGAQDLGTKTVAEVAEDACALLPGRLHEPLTKLLLNWWDEMPPVPEMCEFIAGLKSKGFGIYLLSNTPPEIYNRMDSIPAFRYFDGIIASCDWKCVKPDPEIYRILFREFSLLPEECYFIDDTRVNIDGASAVGMKGHCYSHGSIELLRRAMRDEGII